MKITAVTIFFDGTVQERKGEQVISNQQNAHFEIGAVVDVEKDRKVSDITESLFGGSVSVTFSDGIVWKYKGFKYIIS